VNYPYRSTEQQSDLERLPDTQFYSDDKPFLKTERYSLSPDYEPSDINCKRNVDAQSAQDNQYWFELSHTQRTSEVM
jgi:hypothetical protein